MEYEDASRRDELQAAYVDACESVATKALWAVALLVIGVIAALQGELIGHFLGLMGLVFAWLAREPLREARRLRAALRDEPDSDRPGLN